MIDIEECIDMLEPAMPNSLEGLDNETPLSLLIPNTTELDFTKLPDWRDRIPKKYLRKVEQLLHSLASRDDGPSLVELTETVFVGLGKQGKCDLTWMCAELFKAPYALGTALRWSWTAGHHGSILGQYSKGELLHWFKLAAPETLMTEEERNVLATLPDPVHAYRGADTSDGLSWTLNRDVAEKFITRADEWDICETRLFEEDIPRSSIVAYFDDREEKEIIVSRNGSSEM